MDDHIVRHCRELDRCNQRGGRMLSMLDLLAADTLDLDLAAFLMAHVARGASVMVGANPGGAGKTTVMCALINLAPAGLDLAAADARTVRAVPVTGAPKRCYVCHEIGAGRFFAYLWGRDLRAYCALSERGHTLATNLHADDLPEARDQVCVENGVPEAHFNAFRVLVFLRVSGGYGNAQRWIEKVYLSDGHAPHALVYDTSRGLMNGVGEISAPWVAQCRSFLEACRDTGVRTIEDTRRAFLQFLDGHA
ncbi:MAG: hypothetical protein GWP08_00035 [Nitrospiraceae bacterium]|nr:hypothetical protein [Nitrospiraceae bacterium]